MLTIETTIKIQENGELSLANPLPVAAGEYQAVLVTEEKISPPLPFALPVIDVPDWDENLSLRREDIYGDDGR